MSSQDKSNEAIVPAAEPQAPEMPSPSTLRKVTVGATIGAIVEWFDIAVYGYLAVEIGATFFKTNDPAVALLESFAVFGLAYVVRPLGGIFFGALGDRIGRQKTLAWIIILVAASTFAIGFIPGQATAGVWSPLLLVFFRLVQGFSAGGEMGGASAFVAEYSPVRQRGFFVSWVELGAIAGFLVGAVTVTILRLALSDSSMLDWGWRVPFYLAGPLGAVGLYIRLKLEETPEFVRLQRKNEVAKNPLKEVVIHHWPQILRAGGFALFQNIALYVILTFTPSFQTKTIKYSELTSSISSLSTLVIIVVLIPIVGRISDQVGRKPVLITGCVAGIIAPYPLFLMMTSGTPALAIISHIGLGIMLAIFLGPVLVTINELFETKVRLGGFGIGYNVSVALFGGTAPLIVGLLIRWTGIEEAPGLYIALSAIVTLLVVLGSNETAPIKTGEVDIQQEVL